MTRKTIFSPCRKWRYTLWRELEPEFMLDSMTNNPNTPVNAYVQFIGLNPSTADENKDDNTIRRCIKFAKHWGFSAMCMTNIFAWRDTDPDKMKLVDDPTGPENNTRLLEIGKNASLIVAAWGGDGTHRNRQDWVKKMFFDCELKLYHLGLNGDGTPKHPLYLKKTTTPTIWI